MKTRLWRVHFQSRKYSGEHDDFTIEAQNVVQVVKQVMTWKHGYKLTELQSVELLGEAS